MIPLSALLVSRPLIIIDAGQSYVVFGKADTTAVNLSTIVSGKGGFAINGIDAGDQSGMAVSGAGDLNGDGWDDLIIGAPFANLNDQTIWVGESYVVFGKPDTKAIDLNQLAEGKGGFILKGIDANDLAGYAVSGAGDVNGDGLADLIIGARGADDEDKKQCGVKVMWYLVKMTQRVSLLSKIIGGVRRLSGSDLLVLAGA
ncbi:conserved hypothetical protein [Beggiatoa sp. SS]|nr:conserved hypothetical protein [Beggiatoa sp. SS]